MKFSRFRVRFLAIFCLFFLAIQAQSWKEKAYYTILLQPDKSDWVYTLGEDVKLEVTVLKDNLPVKNLAFDYEWGIERLEPELKAQSTTANGSVKFKLKGCAKPGFKTFKLSFSVGEQTYSNLINLGFEPDKIVTTTLMPDDFQSFWNATLAEARKVPLAPMMTLMPELCTPDADVYHIRFQNNEKNSYIYGMLSQPKKPGKYPVILRVPGAGVRSYKGDKNFYPAQGCITLEIGIHGIPVNLPEETYMALGKGALKDYPKWNLEDRDRNYYKRVYTGCVRAVDFLCTLEQVDSSRIAVAGGSQGGALSIVTAALDKRIKCLFSYFPALCELAGYANGGVGGWPHLFIDVKNSPDLENKIKGSAYYDVVNFARFVTVPGMYTWGYNDVVCPPSSIYSAYNLITAPKQKFLLLETGHWTFNEQSVAEENWLLGQLKLSRIVSPK